MSKFQVLQYTSNPQFPLINQLVNKLIHENYYYFLTVSQCLDLKDYLLARYIYDPLSYSAGIGTPISKHSFIIISHTHTHTYIYIYIYIYISKSDKTGQSDQEHNILFGGRKDANTQHTNNENDDVTQIPKILTQFHETSPS
jgi:hypothetical protein